MKKIAFLFPGQGSQKVGMLANYAKYEVVKDTFQKASTIVGIDLWELIQNGPKEKLDRTLYTQPAILASSVALWRLWQEKSGKALDATFVAGHSLGEYSALVACNALSFEDAMKLVKKRAQLMDEYSQLAKQDVIMLAVLRVSADCVEKACNKISDGTWPVITNYNSDEQTVVAGSKYIIEKFIETISQDASKVRCVKLPMSCPSHCTIMKPIAHKLQECQVSFRNPTCTYISNVTAKPEQDPSNIKKLMLKQIYSPVKWKDSIEFLLQENASTFVELGPGKILSRLLAKTKVKDNLEIYNVDSHDSDIEYCIKSILEKINE